MESLKEPMIQKSGRNSMMVTLRQSTIHGTGNLDTHHNLQLHGLHHSHAHTQTQHKQQRSAQRLAREMEEFNSIHKDIESCFDSAFNTIIMWNSKEHSYKSIARINDDCFILAYEKMLQIRTSKSHSQIEISDCTITEVLVLKNNDEEIIVLAGDTKGGLWICDLEKPLEKMKFQLFNKAVKHIMIVESDNKTFLYACGGKLVKVDLSVLKKNSFTKEDISDLEKNYLTSSTINSFDICGDVTVTCSWKRGLVKIIETKEVLYDKDQENMERFHEGHEKDRKSAEDDAHFTVKASKNFIVAASKAHIIFWKKAQETYQKIFTYPARFQTIHKTGIINKERYYFALLADGLVLFWDLNNFNHPKHMKMTLGLDANHKNDNHHVHSEGHHGIIDILHDPDSLKMYILNNNYIEKCDLKLWDNENFFTKNRTIHSISTSNTKIASCNLDTISIHDYNLNEIKTLPKSVLKVVLTEKGDYLYYQVNNFKTTSICKVNLKDKEDRKDKKDQEIIVYQDNDEVKEFIVAHQMSLLVVADSLHILKIIKMNFENYKLAEMKFSKQANSHISNLQIINNFLYYSIESSFYKVDLDYPGDEIKCFTDHSSKIQIAKVSYDKVLILKSDHISSDHNIHHELHEQNALPDYTPNRTRINTLSKPRRKSDTEPHLGFSKTHDVIDEYTNLHSEAEKKEVPKSFKIYYEKIENPIRICTHHNNIISDFCFTKDNKYFFVSSFDCSVSFWSRETLEIISWVNYREPVHSVSLGQNDFQLVVGFKTQIYRRENPASATSFQVFGPHQEDYLDILTYIRRIKSSEDKDLNFRKKIVPYNQKYDSYILLPSMVNPLHFYAWHLYIEAYQSSLLTGSFHNSIKGSNPLNLLSSRDEGERVINTLRYKLSLTKLNPYILGFINTRTLIEINKKGYHELEDIYKISFVNYERNDLLKFCSEGVKLPIAYYSPVVDPSPEHFADKGSYDFHEVPLIYKTSYFGLNMVSGSSESLELILSICNCPNSEIFTTDFIRLLLREKWQNIKWLMMFQGLTYIFYLLSLMFYLTSDLWPIPYLSTDLILLIGFCINAYLIFYELIQMFFEGLEYWREAWNYVDLIRFSLYTALCIVVWYDYTTIQNSGYFNDLKIVLVLVSWIRGLTYFSLINSTRYLTALILEVISDMSSFMILTFYSIIGLSLMLFCSSDVKNDMFYSYFGFTFMTTIGEYESFGHSASGFQPISLIIFTITSIINTIVMMNLLISIIGDTFDRVQQGIAVADLKQLGFMIYEIESLMFWRRNRKETVYMQRLCPKHGEKNEEVVWDGKLREIKNAVFHAGSKIEGSVKNLAEKTDSVMKELKKKADKVENNEGMKELQRRMEITEKKMNDMQKDMHKILVKLGVE